MVCSLGGIKIHLFVVLDASYVYSDKFSMSEFFRFDFSFLALLMAHPCFDFCLVKGEIWLELSSFFLSLALAFRIEWGGVKKCSSIHILYIGPEILLST